MLTGRGSSPSGGHHNQSEQQQQQEEAAMATDSKGGGGLAAESRARDALRVSAQNRTRMDALSSSLAAAATSSSATLSPSFFEGFALRGIRVIHIYPGFIRCTFTVPNSLTDSTTGCLAAGAVVSLVDEIGSAAAISDGKNLKVSVDMSVSFPDLSQARPGDQLCITARALGHKAAYSGTHVLLANANTGHVVAEGRHSLFGNMKKPKPNNNTATLQSKL